MAETPEAYKYIILKVNSENLFGRDINKISVKIFLIRVAAIYNFLVLFCARPDGGSIMIPNQIRLIVSIL